MTETADFIEGQGDARVLIVADHASNHVPDGLHLGIAEALLNDHIAVDIGAGPLAAALAQRLRCHAIIARFSRLVVDLNRDPHEKAVIPEVSDGYAILGNQGLDEAIRLERIDRFWRPYHEAVADAIERRRPGLLLSLHSFTPRLASRPEEKRPWEIGILYNEDDRAASAAIPLFRADGIVTGDNEPYSGRLLNASMNRHAEARGLPYLGIEVRQDLIDNEAGVARWSERIAPVVEQTCAALA
jgi:predicted N-formylglutamate amidohydrolase